MKSLTDTAKELLAQPAEAGIQNKPSNHDTTQQEIDAFDDDDLKFLKSHLRRLGVDADEAIDYGFYEYRNRYWMLRRGDTFESVSNFTMKVLFLIVGANPKRIVEIKNVHGKATTLDFTIEDLISIEKFKARVEGQGNFLFEGKATDLARIKNSLFNKEKASVEISRLGQYKDRFFAWANGIYDGKNFYHVDDKGMVEVEKEHYYIPVFGSTRDGDDEDLRNYRRFIHREDATTFKEWAAQFVQVYGDNGKLGIGFFFFAIFSDIIFERTKAAPMLFLFGQRGSGKGTMANSLMALFGTPQDPLMLGGASTVVGFMRKLGQFSNAIVWLDEYKNDIGEKKIESLKNIWDRVGYERGVKDSSNRTQTTPVTSSAILSGQEIPNVEPALFSRTVLCEFKSMQRSQKEVNDFNTLRSMEDAGITNVTIEVLSQRENIKAEIFKSYAEVSTALRAALAEHEVIERQIINYGIMCAAIMVLEKRLELPFTSTEFIQQCEVYILRQNDMMKQSNEVQQFFEMVQYLLQNSLISGEKDIIMTKGLLKIRMVSIIGLYREHARRQGMRPMDRGTLMNYIQNSEAYRKEESKQSSHRFPGLHSPTSCTVFLHSEIKRLYGVDFGDNLQNVEDQEQTPNSPPPDVF